MDGRPTWTDCDEAGDYVVPNVLSPRDLVSRPDIMDETVPHTLLTVPRRTFCCGSMLPDFDVSFGDVSLCVCSYYFSSVSVAE